MKFTVCRSASLSFLAITSIFLMEFPTRADDLRVLPSTNAQARSRLYQYLLKQAEKAIDQRLGAYERIQTAEQARAWQKERRDIFLRQLGPFPERTPLNAKVTGRLAGNGYRVEKVMYESRPHHHVTALLYLPEGKPPYPAVLVPCGHSATGKAAEAYQKVSILLARNGLAALCYDPISQGERYQCFDAEGKPLEAIGSAATPPSRDLREIPGHPHFLCTAEHTLMGMGAILLGTNTANYRVWDGMRAIDYLVSREDIDARRIGCTGISGGGTITSYLMALDDRIACAAPGCFPTTFRSLLRVAGPQDAEQNIAAQLALGLDEADYVHLRAPKPTALLAGTRDGTFDTRGTWEIFREAKRFYARLDHPERVDLVEADAPHGFTIQLRIGAVRWMRRWLLGKDDAITEPPDQPTHRASDLWCTPKGQVMFLPEERSIFALNLQSADALALQRSNFHEKTSPAERLAQIRKIAGVRPEAELPALSHRLIETIRRDGYSIDKLILKVDDDLELPALAFVPAHPDGDAYLYLHGDGKQADAAADGPIEKLVRQNHLVLAVDLPGLGETVGRHPRNWGRALFGPNAQEFFLAYLLGKSLVGLWTEDAFVCGRFLADYRAKGAPRKVHLIGVGVAGVAALHAAALEPERFASLTLRRTLTSWSSVMRTPTAGNQLSVAVHGALRAYDLPDLMRLLGARRIAVEDPRNAAGKAEP